MGISPVFEGVDVTIELGPPVVTSIIKHHLRLSPSQRSIRHMSCLPNRSAVDSKPPIYQVGSLHKNENSLVDSKTWKHQALANLYCLGLRIDWKSFEEGNTSQSQSLLPQLPTYPFQRQSYWPSTNSYLHPSLVSSWCPPRRELAPDCYAPKPVVQANQTEEVVIRSLRELLDMKDGFHRNLNINLPLRDLGVDSLLVVELCNK